MVPVDDGSSRLPVVDLARRVARLEPELSEAIARVLASGRFLLGPETEALERELARVCGRAHAVAVASGTEALRLALLAMGIRPGDEVIVPALTAVPTAAAVCAAGATPVPVDVGPSTATIAAAAAAAAVTDRTRAVIPVHLYGRRSDVPALGVPVLEDAAQALGALEPTAASAAAAYSFYPTKNLGGIGDGGAVLTDDEQVALDVRARRGHGLTEASGRGAGVGGLRRPTPVEAEPAEPTRGAGTLRRSEPTHEADGEDYEHTIIAGNSRLSEVEAAALRVALRCVEDDNARRREIARRYREVAPDLRWQTPDERHVYHLCVVRVSDRDAFRARMPFDTAVHYPRALTQQPAYAEFARHPCPEAEAWAAECVSLPCFPEMTDDEIEAVCRALQ